jgi:hypothetical protein
MLSRIGVGDFQVQTMATSPSKKEFLCYIVGGFSTLMGGSMLSGEIKNNIFLISWEF